MHLLHTLLCFAAGINAALVPREGFRSSLVLSRRTSNSNSTVLNSSNLSSTTAPSLSSSSILLPSSSMLAKSNATLTPLTPTLRNSSSNVHNSQIKDEDQANSTVFNFAQSPSFPHSGNWTQIDCLTVLTPKPDVSRWNTSGAAEGWTQMLAAWNLSSRSIAYGDISFSTWVFQSFGKQGVECSMLDDVPCEDAYPKACGNDENNLQVMSPAGLMILLSFTNLNTLFRYQGDAIQAANTPISQEMDVFTATFAPVASSDTTSKAVEILGYISDALGFVSAGALSSAFTAVKVFGELSEATATTALSVVNDGVSVTSALLAKIGSPSDDTDESDILNAILANFTGRLQDVQQNYLSQLVDPINSIQLQSTSSLMNTGGLLTFQNATNDFRKALQTSTTAMMYGLLISSAWKASTSNPRPFILRVDKTVQACNASFSSASGLSNMMSEGTAKKTLWCDTDGNSFYLLNAPHFTPCVGRGCEPTSHGDIWTPLDGGDISNLDGSLWGGITIGDIIKSSWGGFIKNQKQNGYAMPLNSSLSVGEDLAFTDGKYPMLGGINTPGFFNFTICLDAAEASQNTLNNSPEICPQKPSAGSTSPTINAPGTFTPGNCGIHVIQYQKHEGDENLLNSYQLDIIVRDNAGLEIGTATKQSAADPLIIVDTSLPFDLIVAAPGPDDSSPVDFWYADQYWTSSMKAQCSFGGYDSGARNGDCSFSCPEPAAKPPVSATIAHPLPTKAINAVGGDTTFINTFHTSTPAPTPTKSAAPPKPTYATGSCGVHVVQYQKNEKSKNPTPNYEIEVTLFDAKKNPISDSGKVTALTLKPVQVPGLVMPFTVTANAADSDPLDFNYGSQSWNSEDKTQCKTGRYDSGSRNMDCGFTC